MTIASIAFGLLWFCHFSLAQILGCDAVNCPLDSQGSPQCTVGNSTARDIGIKDFNVQSGSEPLTWTIMVQNLTSSGAIERDFFLGTPSNVSSQDHYRKDACALFFEGVAPKIKFPGKDREHDNGNCNDALTKPCADDLLKQLQNQFDNGAHRDNRGRNSPDKLCRSLSEAIKYGAPKPCQIASNGYWGDIVVRPLTGPGTAPPLPKDTCYPTTGQNFNLSLVAANRIDISRFNSSQLIDTLYGVTPIVTLAFAGSPQEALTTVSLTCIKPVSPKLVSKSSDKTSISPLKASPIVGRKGGFGYAELVGVAAWLVVHGTIMFT